MGCKGFIKMNKTFLVVLLILTVTLSSVALLAPGVDAFWWLAGCSKPAPVIAPAPVCAPGTHQCTQTAAGCVVSDCVGGAWVEFRTVGGLCEVTGVQPSCWPSRV